MVGTSATYPISSPSRWCNDNWTNAILIFFPFNNTIIFVTISGVRLHKLRIRALGPQPCAH